MAVGGDAFREDKEVGRTIEQSSGPLGGGGALLPALDVLPGFTQSAGWNMLRTKGTILRGGHSPGRRLSEAQWAEYKKTKPGAFTKNRKAFQNFRLNNPLTPRNWSRYADMGDVTGANVGSPYQLSRGVNFLGRHGALGGWAKKQPSLLSGGTLGRTQAAAAVFRGAPTTHAMDFLAKSGVYSAADLATYRTSEEIGSALLMGGKGSVSQAIGGFQAGARAAVRGSTQEGMVTLAKTARTESAERGITYAGRLAKTAAFEPGGSKILAGVGRKVAGEAAGKTAVAAANKVAARVGLKLGAAVAGTPIPGLNVALWAWTALDIAKASVEIGVPLTKAGWQDWTSGMRRPIGGTGYIDTEAAATSRARGVMAIQNSRLNARSVLGAEAGALAQHFG